MRNVYNKLYAQIQNTHSMISNYFRKSRHL